MSNQPELEKLMKIKCYIMCYYPPEIALTDKIRVEIRNELLKDFLNEKIITKESYQRLVGK
ncbi:MAG: hypothetical protein JXA54_01795 [Candidatus Heimdallarchaeota archaeon]|nr:hypothetical protein [Candidatus Heimdallarchaeota archaeon]